MLSRRRWHDPQTGPFDQIGNTALKFNKRSVLRWRPNHKDQIIAWGDVVVVVAHRLSRPALGAVAIMGLAKLLADHKAAPRMAHAIAGDVHDKERMRPRLTVTTHPLKLLRSLQPLAAPHVAPIYR